MAVSSIFTNIEIKDDKSAKVFLKAIEKSREKQRYIKKNPVNYILLEKDEIKDFLESK